jgi:hypothetical protein
MSGAKHSAVTHRPEGLRPGIFRQHQSAGRSHDAGLGLRQLLAGNSRQRLQGWHGIDPHQPGIASPMLQQDAIERHLRHLLVTSHRPEVRIVVPNGGSGLRLGRGRGGLGGRGGLFNRIDRRWRSPGTGWVGRCRRRRRSGRHRAERSARPGVWLVERIRRAGRRSTEVRIRSNATRTGRASRSKRAGSTRIISRRHRTGIRGRSVSTRSHRRCARKTIPNRSTLRSSPRLRGGDRGQAGTAHGIRSTGAGHIAASSARSNRSIRRVSAIGGGPAGARRTRAARAATGVVATVGRDRVAVARPSPATASRASAVRNWTVSRKRRRPITARAVVRRAAVGTVSSRAKHGVVNPGDHAGFDRHGPAAHDRQRGERHRQPLQVKTNHRNFLCVEGRPARDAVPAHPLCAPAHRDRVDHANRSARLAAGATYDMLVRDSPRSPGFLRSGRTLLRIKPDSTVTVNNPLTSPL